MELEQIKIYRMTHIENIPHILKFGITHKNSLNSNPNFVAIGDLSLIDNRSTKEVRIDNGDFLDFSAPTIILGNFIPFYFGLKMPMLYVVQNGGNFVKQATRAEDIVYLACSLNLIINSDLTYYFCDGHATDNFTNFFDETKISELPTIIDWNAVKSPYWGGQENLNLKRKKQAEFLILGDVPPNFIIGYGCYNNIAKNKLIDMGVEEIRIKEIENSYF
jgi:hypothetical protein